MVTSKGETTAHEIRVDGKILDEINNCQHIGSNRMKQLQHIVCCSRNV